MNNLSGYVWAVNYGLIELGTGAGSAIFNAPFAVVDAVGELIGGDPAAALNTLVTGIVDPVQTGIQNALAGVGWHRRQRHREHSNRLEKHAALCGVGRRERFGQQRELHGFISDRNRHDRRR